MTPKEIKFLVGAIILMVLAILVQDLGRRISEDFNSLWGSTMELLGFSLVFLSGCVFMEGSKK